MDRTVKSFANQRQKAFSEKDKSLWSSNQMHDYSESGYILSDEFLKKGFFDFEKLFRTEKKRIVLEIGTGSGDLIATSAYKNTDCGYIGIEVYKTGLLKTLKILNKLENDVFLNVTGESDIDSVIEQRRSEKRNASDDEKSDESRNGERDKTDDGKHEKNNPEEKGNPLTNIKLINADAVDVLEKNIPQNSLDEIDLFFPDPWPKKKHHKRRIVKKEFLDLVYPLLKTGGIFKTATDWQDYADQMEAVFDSHDGFKLIEHNYIDAETKTGSVYSTKTRFERRAEKYGLSVNSYVFEKI